MLNFGTEQPTTPRLSYVKITTHNTNTKAKFRSKRFPEFMEEAAKQSQWP
jgi:hypothetical protein